jgi:hypothetical protein
MELTSLAAASLFLVGFGYVFVRRVKRLRVVCWTVLGVSLFALATRDLFRSRERGRPAAAPRRATNRTTKRTDDERQRTPLLKRVRRRLGGWLG